MNGISASLSGLAASRLGMAVAQSNISGASDPFYARQRLELGASMPMRQGNLLVGAGVEALRAVSLSDRLGAASYANAASAAASAGAKAEYSGKIADAFGADRLSAAASALSKAYGQAASVNDRAVREELASAARTMAMQTNASAGRLAELAAGLPAQASDAAALSNGYLRQIGELNREISEAQAGSAGSLESERMKAFFALSEQTGASYFMDGQAMSVQIANATVLSAGHEPAALSAQGFADGTVGYSARLSNGIVMPLGEPGGKMGGLAEAGRQILQARSDLDQFAAALGERLNLASANANGADGAAGAPVFAWQESQTVSASAAIAGGALVSSRLGTYQQGASAQPVQTLAWTGASWSLAPLSAQGLGGAQGFSMPGQSGSSALSYSGAPADGERYALAPSWGAAASFRAAAGAGQIGVSEPMAFAGIEGSSALTQDRSDPQWGKAFALVFGANGKDWSASFSDGSLQTGKLSGNELSVAGLSIKFSALPGPGAAGSAFMAPAGSFSGIAAQHAGAAAGSSAAYLSEELGKLASGQKASQEAQNAAEATKSNALASMQSKQGVNLDEEAADLAKWEQAYQANAKALAMSGKLFDIFIAALG